MHSFVRETCSTESYMLSFQPFWRVWNAAGSDGRGVIGMWFSNAGKHGHLCREDLLLMLSITGVLEANFVEPAHDKQGFERTTVLSRLEARLLQMQKSYWSALIVLYYFIFYIFRFLFLTS